MRALISLALAVTLAAGRAPAGQEYDAANGYALSGYDAVAYFGLAQSEPGEPQPAPVPGRTEFIVRYDGADWAFASEENREAFIADPERYAPQYDGHCAFGVSKGGKVPGNPELWRIVDGKLYLNIAPAARDMWEADIPGNLVKSDANWPDLEPTPASEMAVPRFTPAAPLN